VLRIHSLLKQSDSYQDIAFHAAATRCRPGFWVAQRFSAAVTAFFERGFTVAEKLDLGLAFGWRSASALR
jgi:hypothetical protein